MREAPPARRARVGLGVVEVAAHPSHVGLERLLERAVVERRRGVVQRDEDTVVALHPFAVQA